MGKFIHFLSWMHIVKLEEPVLQMPWYINDEEFRKSYEIIIFQAGLEQRAARKACGHMSVGTE